ncbi:MAG: hypothetical protein HT580_13280 [Dechloromonas sp.]|nr:MAG: hypothetical protein HT580_13280 [Dechloromonas sp.]
MSSGFAEMLFRSGLIVGALKRFGQGQARLNGLWFGLNGVLEFNNCRNVVAFFMKSLPATSES